MISNQSHKRTRLQFHLSTAIVLMFVAGVLIWTNSVERLAHFEDTFRTPSGGRVWFSGIPAFGPGWPMVASPEADVDYKIVAWGANLVTALAMLTAVAVDCEWWVRRIMRTE